MQLIFPHSISKMLSESFETGLLSKVDKRGCQLQVGYSTIIQMAVLVLDFSLETVFL